MTVHIHFTLVVLNGGRHQPLVSIIALDEVLDLGACHIVKMLYPAKQVSAETNQIELLIIDLTF